MKKITLVGTIFLFLLITTAYGAQFIDSSGHLIRVKRPFKRIISLYPAHTENLFSLGLDREIIGVSRDEAFPPGARKKPVFSYHDDAERFIAARPDLVLIRPMIAMGYKGLISKLRGSGITVVSLQPRTVDEIFGYWRDLGILTGRETEAKEMIERFKAGLKKIQTVVKTIPPGQRKRVYFESIHSRMMTFSPNSIAIFALTTAGGIDIAKDAVPVRGTNIAAYGKEHILSHGPDIDVYLAQRGAMNRVSMEHIKEEGGFKAIKAVRDGKVYIVDEKIVSRPTLRLLDGIYEIGRILYPERFNDISALKKLPVLTRAEFAEMSVKMLNIRIKTPDYIRDIRRRPAKDHRYGEFRDVDYTGEAYKFIETAVYRGLFPDIDRYRFYPDRPVDRRTVTYALFVYFDFPEVKEAPIRDVGVSDPMYEQIQTVVGLGIMPLGRQGRFRPSAPVSGMDLYSIVSRAMAITK